MAGEYITMWSRQPFVLFVGGSGWMRGWGVGGSGCVDGERTNMGVLWGAHI